MPRAKINPDEFRRLWLSGASYEEIKAFYRDRHGVEITDSAIGNARFRYGLPRRQERDLDLIPWAVKREHWYKHALAMLRALARVRAGREIPEVTRKRLVSWLQFLREYDCVVHYDPDTEEGFFYVPRRPGDDVIRKPSRVTRKRGRRD